MPRLQHPIDQYPDLVIQVCKETLALSKHGPITLEAHGNAASLRASGDGKNRVVAAGMMFQVGDAKRGPQIASPFEVAAVLI